MAIRTSGPGAPPPVNDAGQSETPGVAKKTAALPAPVDVVSNEKPPIIETPQQVGMTLATPGAGAPFTRASVEALIPSKLRDVHPDRLAAVHASFTPEQVATIDNRTEFVFNTLTAHA